MARGRQWPRVGAFRRRVTPLVMTSLLNTGRLRETLDFTPRYSVEEGIELYIEDVKRRESA